jgi:tetratricopeptide (TPR) repeat protein
LPPEDREQLRDDTADLLWALARATALQGAGRKDSLAAALDLNRKAESVLAGHPPKALLQQRKELAEKLELRDEAAASAVEAEKTAARIARDFYLLALRHHDLGQTKDAARELKKAIQQLEQANARDGRDFAAWTLLGKCHDLLQNLPEATTCFNVCIVLEPRSYESHFKLGILYMRRVRWPEAIAAFDRAIALQPDQPEAYVQRAMIHRELKDYAAAEHDLTAALDRGAKETRIYFRRAEIRRRGGDFTGAARDHTEGLRREPSDKYSWVDRGVACLEQNKLQDALADFNQALRIDPLFRLALQDKAHVLGRLGRTEEALAVSDQNVRLHPEFAHARINRGVLRARLGLRDLAHQDARDSLTRSRAPELIYQAANIFALTSQQNPKDVDEAIPLLYRALQGGFGLDVVDIDRDMDPIRANPEFKRIVQDARKYKADLKAQQDPAIDQ